jgi:hypothetical protein
MHARHDEQEGTGIVCERGLERGNGGQRVLAREARRHVEGRQHHEVHVGLPAVDPGRVGSESVGDDGRQHDQHEAVEPAFHGARREVTDGPDLVDELRTRTPCWR